MIGELYNVETHTINYHLKKIFSDHELEENSVIRKFRITAADGKSYDTQHYSLAAIIAVPNEFTRAQLEGRLRGQLEDSLGESMERSYLINKLRAS